MRCTTVVFVVLLTTTAARAEHGPFGLGVIVGQPTGLTMEYELTDHLALDAAVGWDLFQDRHFYTHVEVLGFLTLASGSQVSLAGYLGVGAYFANYHPDPAFGVRVPLGLSVEFTAAPVEIFGEFAFHLRFVPGPIDPGVGAALGFRYYF